MKIKFKLKFINYMKQNNDKNVLKYQFIASDFLTSKLSN